MRGTENQLDELHLGMVQHWLRRLEEGDMTAAELSVMRQFLRDNDIKAVPSAPRMARLDDAVASTELDKILPFTNAR